MAKPRNRPRRRWWQKALRLAVLIALVLGGAYVTLPWWVPRGWLKEYLCRQLSDQMGVRVAIDDLTVSWEEGLGIARLVVDSPPGFAPGPVAVVPRLHADFSPLDFFLRGRIAWMEMEDPQLFLRLDGQGNLNLAPLQRLRSDARTERISFRRAVVSLQLPHRAEPFRLDLGDVEVLAGKAYPVGRIALAGSLHQSEAAAPISLRFQEGPRRENLAGRAWLSFRNVDLEQLHLERLLLLPGGEPVLRKLSGRCSGELELAATTEGKVSRFRLNVGIRRLDAQPARAREWPVIEEAFLQTHAAFDILSGRLDLFDANVRLPGVDMTGKAVAFFDSLGQWSRVSAMEFTGEIHPDRLAAILLLASPDANDVRIEGPVQVSFAGWEPNDPRASTARLLLTAAARATDARIEHGGAVLKPAGRTLEVDLRGELDLGDWSYRAQGDQVVRLGGNRFGGTGTLRNLRMLTERWSAPAPQGSAVASKAKARTVRDALGDLAHLDWDGTWEVRDLAALVDLWPSVAGPLRALDLKGVLTGRCAVEHTRGTRVHASVTAPPGTQLAAGGIFRKPVEQELRLTASAAVADLPAGADRAAGSPAAACKDIDLSLWVGPGRFHLSNGRADFADDANAPVTLAVECGWDVEKAENLLKCFALPLQPDVCLAGSLEGKGSLTGNASGWRLAVSATADQAAFSVGQVWTKPAGQAAAIDLQLLAEGNDPGPARARLSVGVAGPRGQLAAAVESPWPPAPPAASLRGHVQAEADVLWLVESSPALARLLCAAEVSGTAAFDGDFSWDGAACDANVHFRGDPVDFSPLALAAFNKPRGMPLDLRLRGRWAPSAGNDKSARVDIREGEILLGGCRAAFHGWAAVNSVRLPASVPDLLKGLDELHMGVRLGARVDKGALDFLPALAAAARACGIAGELQAEANVAVSQQQISLACRVNADNLAVGKIGPFTKPADLPAGMDVSVSLPTNLSRIDVGRLDARLGEANVCAQGGAKLAFSLAGEARIWQRAGALQVHLPSADLLGRVFPAAAPYQPHGDLDLSFRWSDEDGGTVPQAEFRTAGLSAIFRGRRVELVGGLRAEGVALAPPLLATSHASADANETSPLGVPLRIRRLVTDGLEVRAGDNHGWLVMDVADPLHRPGGRVRLLAERLDDKDLSDWLGEPNAPALTGRLTAPQAQALEANAAGLIAAARRLLEGTALDVRAEIDRYRTFDAGVGQAYELRHMVVQADAAGGRLRVQLAGGIGGGTFRRIAETDLGLAAPALTTDSAFQDVLASDATRPQLARFFPGNTVYGSFNHNETLSMPLSAAVANMIDPRAPLRAAGSGKTVAYSGMVEGRAAPQFVANIFPGLNLTQYYYNRMTAFAETKADGTIENDMIFSGQSYDLYMEGSTDADSIARYQTGLILLSSPQSPELNHNLKLGRIPLLKIKARIDAGKLLDMEVSYPWPNETLGTIFIENNLVYRAWITLQKK